MQRCESVGVVGLGLIGGSIARRLRVRGVRVVGWDTDEGTRRRAAEAGILCAESLSALCATEPDLVFLAVPLMHMRPTMEHLAAALRGRTVVSDVGSVKGPISDIVAEYGLTARYVGAHPMAGTELAGFEASNAEMLVGCSWAMTLADETPRRGAELLLSLVTGDMEGRVVPLRDDVHDASVALISHLPHVVANELLNVVGASDVKMVALGLAAGSFRDGTRVAGTNPRRTEAMITENQEWVVSAIREAAAGLVRMADLLEAGEDISPFFDSAAQVKRLLQARSRESGSVDFDALTEEAWRTVLLDIGSGGGQIIAVDPQRGRVHHSG